MKLRRSLWFTVIVMVAVTFLAVYKISDGSILGSLLAAGADGLFGFVAVKLQQAKK